MQVTLDPSSVDDYRMFLKIKRLPRHRFAGRVAWFPDEYASQVGLAKESRPTDTQYSPPAWMFDYQREICRIAIAKRKYAIFADCGLGKTAMLLEFAKHAMHSERRPVLIVSPLMVCEQTIAEAANWYCGEMSVEHIRSAEIDQWLANPRPRIGITNYEAFTERRDGRWLGGLILDESSMLKSHYGKWAGSLIELGRHVPWKLACTGTPAPNDRIEFANHAVFLDRFRTVNQFLATYFINRGQTQNRWELKPHALRPFYRALSDWCIFLSDPAVYGWKDNTAGSLPPIRVHVEDVPMTADQVRLTRELTGDLFVGDIGGIATRGKLSKIGKGIGADSAKPQYIADRIASWSESESTIVWCHYNAEQDHLAKVIPDSVSISGSTPHDERRIAIDRFKRGEVRTLITKPKILGFGLNLQCCTRQVFSGLNDSYESYYQAVKRSNRVGSTKPLDVHIPVTEAERPLIESVLRKANRIDADTAEQQALFRAAAV